MAIEELKKIWMNGELVDWKEAKIHVLTHTLHYGSGVFEGIRAYQTNKGTAVFRLSEHIARLFYSASALGIEIPFSQEEIEEAILKTIRVNEIKECYVRPLVFCGYGVMGLNFKGAPIEVAIAVWPWGAYLGGEKAIKIKISKYIRIHPQSTVADAKICGHYVNSILASLEAKKAGFDESLFLDFNGKVAEGPGENIFMIKDGKLFTPKQGSILPGLTRSSVEKIAHDLGLKTEQKEITVEELKSADEAFFSGTAVEIQPIGSIDDTVIGKGGVGEITTQIKNVYEQAIRGQDKRYLEWLSFV